MSNVSGPYRSIGSFASFSLANARGTTQLEDQVGLTLHTSATCSVERRRGSQSRSFSPGVASSFIDLPGNRTEVVLRGRANLLQSTIPIARIEVIASEDHDCPVRLDRLSDRQNVEDFDLFRLAIWSRRSKQHSPVIERELVGRLLQLTQGKVVDLRGGLPPVRLVRLESLVRDRLSDITVTEMAESVGLTLYHFTREFKRATGLTPWAYVVRERLKRTIALIRSTNLDATGIATQSGFSHASHLSRHMQAQLGLAPAELRRVLRG